jgi:pimeloyl-ACP methyl ester carboxylesterase
MPVRDPNENFARLAEVELCYDEFGDAGDPACLLIMGLGTQMIAWPEEFCESLAGRGHHVIRFDNRDCGRSTHLDGAPVPTLRELLTRRVKRPAYLLDDMARDAAGLLDELGVDRAHVVGASMGAMIAQTLAVTAPERVVSLVSIMGNTGGRILGQPSLRLFRELIRPPATDRASYIEQVVAAFELVGSPGFERDEAALRELLELSYDRGVDPHGFARQLGAIVASGSRRRSLARITAPTLVIHGSADRLVAPSGGRATARAIPGANLLMVGGMGHDLPRGVWPLVIDAITGNAARAEPGARTAVAGPRR